MLLGILKKIRQTKISFVTYKNYIQYAFILIFLIFIIKILDTNQLFELLQQVKIEYIFTALLLFLILMFLTFLRSFILIKKFTNIKSTEFFKINVYGMTANSITFTSFANDIFKYYTLKKKIYGFNSLVLILFDKFINLYFKIFYLIILFNVANIFIINFYSAYILTISIVIIILFLYLFINFKKIFSFVFKTRLIEKKKYLFICANYDYVLKKYFYLLV